MRRQHARTHLRLGRRRRLQRVNLRQRRLQKPPFRRWVATERDGDVAARVARIRGRLGAEEDRHVGAVDVAELEAQRLQQPRLQQARRQHQPHHLLPRRRAI